MGRAAREPDDTAIEFLPADQHAFGPGAGDSSVFAGFDDEDDPFDAAPRSRWLVGVSAAVVTALVAVGVVAASPWADTAAAPATTVPVTAPVTAPVSTTVGTTAATDPEPMSTAPGIVLDPVPDGFALRQSRVGPDVADPAYGWGEVWAAPGATRFTGRWFSVTFVPFAEMGDLADQDAAVDVGGRRGVLATDPAGVSTLRFDSGQTDAARLVTVSAFGFTDAGLIELGASIGVEDDRPQLVDDRPTFLRPELLDGLVRIAAGPAADDLVDEVLQPHDRTAATIYSGGPGYSGDGDSSDRDSEELVLLQAAPVPTGPAVLTALALDEQILVTPPAGLEGEGLVVGRRTVRNTLVSVAWWDIDGQRITVLSTLDPEALVPLLPTVRIVGAAPPWILEPGLQGYIAAAASDPEPIRAEAQPAGTFELWATPGASRAQGTWVAVQQLPWVVGGSVPGRRIAVGDGTGVIDEGDTVTALTWSPDDGSTITVTAHGLTVGQLVTVAELSARGDAQLLGETLFDGMSAVLDRPTVSDVLDEELFTRSRSTSTFTRPDDHRTVVVESAPIDPDEEALLRFVVDGDRGTLDVYGSRTSVITFRDGTTRVIVRSDLSLDELEQVAPPGVRPATAAEWDVLVAGPPNYVNGPLAVDPRPQQVALGVTQAGTSWRVNVDVGRGTVGLDDNGAEDRFMIDDLLADRAVTLRSTPSTTFVVVRAAPELGAVVARVTAGGSARVIALRSVDGDDHLYGALAFSEDGDVTVELLDDEGRVVDGAA